GAARALRRPPRRSGAGETGYRRAQPGSRPRDGDGPAPAGRPRMARQNRARSGARASSTSSSIGSWRDRISPGSTRESPSRRRWTSAGRPPANGAPKPSSERRARFVDLLVDRELARQDIAGLNPGVALATEMDQRRQAAREWRAKTELGAARALRRPPRRSGAGETGYRRAQPGSRPRDGDGPAPAGRPRMARQN